MNQDLLNNQKLQTMLNGLREGETTEDRRDQPLGKYGRIAMKHLHDTNPQRFSLLKMTGELMSMMYLVDDDASERVEAIIHKLLEKDPVPQTDDIFEKARHYNTKKCIAEELVITEMVLIPR